MISLDVSRFVYYIYIYYNNECFPCKLEQKLRFLYFSVHFNVTIKLDDFKIILSVVSVCVYIYYFTPNFSHQDNIENSNKKLKERHKLYTFLLRR